MAAKLKAVEVTKTLTFPVTEADFDTFSHLAYPIVGLTKTTKRDFFKVLLDFYEEHHQTAATDTTRQELREALERVQDLESELTRMRERQNKLIDLLP